MKLNNFSTETREKMALKLNDFSSKDIDKDTILSWFKIYNIKDDSFWWMPLQFFFQGYSTVLNNEQSFTPSMSTGTATHWTFKKSLINSLIESIQINDFNNAWYYGKKMKKINIKNKYLTNEIEKILENVDIKPTFYLLESEEELISVLCVLENKNNLYPQFTFGIQTSNNKSDAITRSLFEAAAVYRSTFYTYIYNKKARSTGKKEDYVDLDRNVQFWCLPENRNKHKKILEELTDGYIDFEEIKDLIMSEEKLIKFITKNLIKNGKNIFLYNITPPEIKDLYSINRVFIPENCPVFLPDFPFEFVNGLKKVIKNKYVHPLP